MQNDEGKTAEQRTEQAGESRGYPTLAELVEKLPEVEEHWRSECLEMPGPHQVGAALLTELIAIERRIEAVVAYLEAQAYDDDALHPNQLELQRRVASADCGDVNERLQGMREALVKWLQVFGQGSLVELDADVFALVKRLAPLCQGASKRPEGVVRAAVMHLAECPNADWLIARAEQQRQLAIDPEAGKAATGWPWRRPDGGFWTDAAAASSPVVSADTLAIAAARGDSVAAANAAGTLTITPRPVDDVFSANDHATIEESHDEFAYLLAGRDRCYVAVSVPVKLDSEVGDAIYERGVVLTKGGVEAFVQAVAGLCELFDPLPGQSDQ